MIPLRVKLKGFLCYKEEQEISFDGNASLWMLSGLNGSGKSSIFDAVTYALFGHHRGGAKDHEPPSAWRPKICWVPLAPPRVLRRRVRLAR